MQQRKLGKQGLEVSALGLGCMGMSFAYGSADDTESIRVLHRSLELGINFWDTAEIYGPYKNEELIGRALKGISRDKVIIATKFGFKISHTGDRMGADSRPAHVKESIAGSLKRLGTDYIDLYYQHRLDPNTPIEETMGALSELVKEGKVRYLGLSEVGPGTIRRAHKVFPLTAVQSEYSLWERGIEEKVLPTLRELGIGLVPYSPIGRGFLSGRFKSANDFEESDWRRDNPRFRESNFQHNLELVKIIQEIATAHNITAAQLALAWVLKQGENIVPIPGTKHIKYLEENVKAVAVSIPESAWSQLHQAVESFQTAGARYPEGMPTYIDKTP